MEFSLDKHFIALEFFLNRIERERNKNLKIQLWDGIMPNEWDNALKWNYHSKNVQ